METLQFKLPVGAKRQVTIPKRCMELLSLEEGGDLLLEIVGDHAILHPMVSVPRRELPEELRVKFEARRGAKRTDIPLDQFLKEIGYAAKPGKKIAAAAKSKGSVKVDRYKTNGKAVINQPKPKLAMRASA